MKIRALTGMPVVYTASGARLGRVTRVHVDPELKRIEGFWVSGRLGRLFFCPAREVELLGAVSVLVRACERHPPVGLPFHLRRALDASGALIGAIVGAYVREDTLEITALELTRGFWEDLVHGHEQVRDYAVRLPEGDVAVWEGEASEDEEGFD